MVNDDPSDDEFIPSPNIHPGILEPQRSACLPLVRVCARAHAFRYSQVDDPPGRLAVPHVLARFLLPCLCNCIDLCSGGNFNTFI